jgi:hypothetical protein
MKSLQFIEVDTPAFDQTSPVGQQTWRFAVPTDYLPREVDCIPSISAITYTPATISLGEDLGQRATLQITFKDHLHVMNGEPFGQGTFWGKWRARYGQKLRGRAVRWLNGLEGQALTDMPTRHFFIDSVDGPTPDGVYTINAKDLLKFADDNRAQAPRLSNGKIGGALDTSTPSATLTPGGIGNAEYPASGHLCIGGKEIVSFTRSGDSLTITRGQLGTTAIAHDAGERAQLVLYYDGDDVADIIYDLFTNYAGISSTYLPLTEWKAETSANLGVIYARPITEPTPVNKLVSQLVEQAALAIWWDELARLVRLQVLKEIATDAAVFDEDVIVERSLKVKEQPDKRISQIWTYFGQRNPADRGDDEDNYRFALADLDLALETQYGGSLFRKIVGQWIATQNAAERLNQVQMSRFRDPPRNFNFDLFPGTAISAGRGYRLRWRQNQDVDGNVVEDGAPIQITRVAVEAGVIHVEAEEMLASGVVVLTNVVILTDTSGLLNWTVPADWNNADNSIHCIGGGGGGSQGQSSGDGDGGGGGGGGAYSAITNLTLTPGASIQYRIGIGGDGGAGAGAVGGDTWFNGATLGASSVGAKGGAGGLATGGSNGGVGGQSSSGIGATKISGGNGGPGYEAGSNSAGGGGGGGAAGPNGNGAAGGGNISADRDHGGGGGGANGGSVGGEVASGNSAGGSGGNNRFNFGGGTGATNGVAPTLGQDGGGGGGGYRRQTAGASGGTGEAIWTQTIAPIFSAGPGGGAGGGGGGQIVGPAHRIGEPGGDGGLYGGGGGGGGNAAAEGGNGAQGVIAIVYRGL